MKKFEFEFDWTENTTWLLPDGEEMFQNQFKIVDEQIDAVLDAVAMCKELPPRHCVQAGGAFGLYPARLTHYFDRVTTFEPHPINWRCLMENVKRYAVNKIELVNAALTDERGYGAMMYSKKVLNSFGAHYCQPLGDADPRLTGGAHVLMQPLDDFEFDDVDLIWLDVEGAELDALRGASSTIHASRPVIALEDRVLPHMKKPHEAGAWLEKHFNYRRVARSHADVIFIPK